LAQIRAGNAGPGENITINNETLADFANYLEHRLGQQVIDQTGRANLYDIKLHILAESGESREDALKRAILDQLGLQLIPTNMLVDTLVVEKVK
jgi:uncharacterized protein (TIGR03435 family)